MNTIESNTIPVQEHSQFKVGQRTTNEQSVDISMDRSEDHRLSGPAVSTTGRVPDQPIEHSPAMDDMAQPDFLCQDLPIPLHPGAERFYQEAGAL